MSEQPTCKSGHPWFWVVLVIAVPLIYVLSWPWVSIYVSRPGASSNSAYRTCGIPWIWLTAKSPLLMPLSRYQIWCHETAYPGSIIKNE